MDILALDTILIILGYLKPKDILNLRLVNKFFNNFIKENELDINITIKEINENNINRFLNSHKFLNLTFYNVNINESAEYLQYCRKITLYSTNIKLKCFEKLTNCRSITISGLNNIKKICENITYLNNCKEINFYGQDKIDGECAELLNKTKLESISIYGNISKNFFKILNIPNLKSLALRIRNKRKIEPYFLSSNLSNLESLYFEIKINNNGLETFCEKFKNLKKLYLTFRDFNTPTINLSNLVKLDKLESLVLNFPYENVINISDFTNFKNLKYLSLFGYYSINVSDSCSLENTKLKTLNIDNILFQKLYKNQIIRLNLMLINLNVPNLKNISLSKTHITDKEIEFLNRFNLETILLDGCEKITNQALKILNLPNLKYLDISYTNISNEGILALKTPKLKYINLNNCNITDKLFELLKMSSLYCIKVKSCNLEKTIEILDKRYKEFPYLQKIDISFTKVTGRFKNYDSVYIKKKNN